MPMQTVLDDLEAVLKQKIDPDILLISSLVKKCYINLSQDPLRLASEILSRFRPLQGKSLIRKSHCILNVLAVIKF
jgi:hypothetical protein